MAGADGALRSSEDDLPFRVNGSGDRLWGNCDPHLNAANLNFEPWQALLFRCADEASDDGLREGGGAARGLLCRYVARIDAKADARRAVQGQYSLPKTPR